MKLLNSVCLRWCIVLCVYLSANTLWAACTEEDKIEMRELGVSPDVIAYTCDEEVEIPDSTDPIEEFSAAPTTTPVDPSLDPTPFRLGVGIGMSGGTYTKNNETVDLTGTLIEVHYHWQFDELLMIGAQFMWFQMGGAYNAVDKVKYEQQSIAFTFGGKLIALESGVQLIAKGVLGFPFLGNGHLTDNIENAEAQASLNGIEFSIFFDIDPTLYLGADYGVYSLPLLEDIGSGIDVKYPGTTGKARVNESFRFFAGTKF